MKNAHTAPRNAGATLIVLLTALAMVFGALFLSAPSAEAQPELGEDIYVAPGDTCPADHRDLGTFVDAADMTLRTCRPNGFWRLGDYVLCAELLNVPDDAQVPYFPGIGTCVNGGFPADSLTECTGGTVALNEELIFSNSALPPGDPFNACVFPYLTNYPLGEGVDDADRACIAGDIVQNDPAAASLTAGAFFKAEDGHHYIIDAGPARCQFYCEDGFDVNCDGKIGDFCPVGTNPHVVAHVKACLAALNPASAEPAAAAASPAAAAPAAQAIAVGGTGGGLAHTGVDTQIPGILGATMLGAGALLEAGRRKRKNA